MLLHGAIEVIPLAFDLDIGFVHAPADPHRSLAAVKGFLQERAVFDHPPVDGRVIHVDTSFEHEFFDVARAQGVGDIPADTHQNNVLREMGPFEADRHRLSPPWQHGSEGETIPQIASNENLRQSLCATVAKAVPKPSTAFKSTVPWIWIAQSPGRSWSARRMSQS